jgi:hypothetical protein
MIAADYVRNTFIKKLMEMPIELPAVGTKPREEVTAKDLGIGYPILINPGDMYPQEVPDEEAIEKHQQTLRAANQPTQPSPFRPGVRQPIVAPQQPNLTKILTRFDFTLQFCWKETPASKRLMQRQKEKAQAQAAAQPLDEAGP